MILATCNAVDNQPGKEHNERQWTRQHGEPGLDHSMKTESVVRDTHRPFMETAHNKGGRKEIIPIHFLLSNCSFHFLSSPLNFLTQAQYGRWGFNVIHPLALHRS